jgi:hypothetical protein
MLNDFVKIIEEDIKKCDEEIINGNKQSREKLRNFLISKYRAIIDGFDTGLQDLFYDKDGTYCKDNLELMKQKLVLFKAMGYKNIYAKTDSNTINVHNTNALSPVFNITFSEAKKKVGYMTSLKEEEIVEIHAKIDELEQIINSSDRKSEKWEKANDIIKWVADKGIDVGITMLPLILKLGE